MVEGRPGGGLPGHGRSRGAPEKAERQSCLRNHGGGQPAKDPAGAGPQLLSSSGALRTSGPGEGPPESRQPRSPWAVGLAARGPGASGMCQPAHPSPPPPPRRSVGGPLPEGNAWQCLAPLLFLRRLPARPLWLDRRQPGRATSPRAPALRPSHPTVHPPESPHTAAEAGTSKIREGANPLLTSSGITRHLLTHSRSHWEPCLGSCGSVPPPSPPHVFLNHFGTPLNLCFFFREFFHFGFFFFFFFFGFFVFFFRLMELLLSRVE